MELRPITDEDRAGWRACLATAFGRYQNEEVEQRELDELGFDKTLAAFDGGEVVGTAGWFPVELTMPGLSILPVASVVAVTVLPSHRRQGILRGLMRRQLGDLRQAGLAAAVLTASEGGIYGRFGYGAATGKCDYELDKRVARLARPPAAPGAVRMLTPVQAEEAAPALWEAHRRRRPGELSVPSTYWWGHFNVRDWTGADPDRRFFAAYEHEGVIEGLADFVRVESDSGPRERAVDVELLFASSREAYEALCAFLIGIDLAITLRMGHRPLDEPLRHLLVDGRQLRTTRTVDDVWIRPLDVAAALSCRHYVPVGSGPLVLHVHDELFPANEGCYALSVDSSGTASVSGPEAAGAGAGAAALEMDVGVLGSVLLGGRRLAPFVEAGLVREHTPGAAWRADAMFLSEREPFATISF